MIAFFQAKTKADMITPAITAIAKSCHTVIAETATNTKASALGIFLITLKLLHANVPITTINITPTRAAIGICSIKGAAKRIKIKREIEAVTPESLPLPPELTLIMDCPIMAHPPIPPNKPFNIFPNPCAKLSLFPLPLLSVSSSTKLSVISDSIKPTAANKKAVEITKLQ